MLTFLACFGQDPVLFCCLSSQHTAVSTIVNYIPILHIYICCFLSSLFPRQVFLTCQVRVVRFYVSSFPPLPPPPRPPPPHLKRKCRMAVFPAGPQPAQTTAQPQRHIYSTQPQHTTTAHNHNHSTQPEDSQTQSRTAKITRLTTMATCSSQWHQDK